jgi:prolipoprotein diacylglyceryltransferase
MRKREVVDRSVVGAYLVMTALVRFVIQWLRVYEPFVGPFGFAHFAALVVMAAGIYLLVTPPAAPARSRR